MPGGNFCLGHSLASRRGLDIDRGKVTMPKETVPDDKVHRQKRRLIVDGELSLRWGQRKRSRLPKATALDSINDPDIAKIHHAKDVVVANIGSSIPTQPASESPVAALDVCVSSPKAIESRLLQNRNAGSLHYARQKNSASGIAVSPDRQSYSHEGPVVVSYRSRKISADCAVRNGHAHRTTEIHSLHAKPVVLESLNMDLIRWPKILISLSYKEKEDDFMVMKGSKLPQRPRRRAKHIEKSISFVSPGTWLCDMTRDRYEVREKKSLRRKPRGLKAMGSDDSESE